MSKKQTKSLDPFAGIATEHLVDALGGVKAQAASVAEKEKALKDALILRGVKEVEGEYFRVTISQSEKSTLDMDAVRAKLSPQFIRANTKVTPVITVRVSARVADPVASIAA